MTETYEAYPLVPTSTVNEPSAEELTVQAAEDARIARLIRRCNDWLSSEAIKWANESNRCQLARVTLRRRADKKLMFLRRRCFDDQHTELRAVINYGNIGFTSRGEFVWRCGLAPRDKTLGWIVVRLEAKPEDWVLPNVPLAEVIRSLERMFDHLSDSYIESAALSK